MPTTPASAIATHSRRWAPAGPASRGRHGADPWYHPRRWDLPDAIAGGRVTLAFTAAQLAAMADVGTNQSVVITADPNGTVVTTQAIYRLTVAYAQKV